MNQILQQLTGGDLRSDGLASEVASVVRDHPELVDDLLKGLDASDDVVRARTADALEKLTRDKPEYLLTEISHLIQLAQRDRIPMVRWHAAMSLTNLLALNQQVNQIATTLLGLLQDKSPFVKSWAIAGLCVLGRRYPRKQKRILERLTHLQQDPSIAIRHRTATAIRLLINPQLSLPAGWLKSRRIAATSSRRVR